MLGMCVRVSQGLLFQANFATEFAAGSSSSRACADLGDGRGCLVVGSKNVRTNLDVYKCEERGCDRLIRSRSVRRSEEAKKRRGVQH